jgi:hypothetical protein
MTSEMMNGYYRSELEKIQAHLSEMGYESRIIEKSEIFPFVSMLVGIEQDYRERDRFLHISFVPMPEEADDILLLQLYTTLPSEKKPEFMGNVEKLILALNNRVALGQFGINDGAISFRHIQVSTQKEPVTGEVFKAVMSLFVYMMDIYEETIEDVATGKESLESAIQTL